MIRIVRKKFAEYQKQPKIAGGEYLAAQKPESQVARQALTRHNGGAQVLDSI
jgi:hypothetical protein